MRGFELILVPLPVIRIVRYTKKSYTITEYIQDVHLYHLVVMVLDRFISRGSNKFSNF